MGTISKIDTHFPAISGKVKDVKTKLGGYKDETTAVIDNLINGETGVSKTINMCYAHVFAIKPSSVCISYLTASTHLAALSGLENPHFFC